MDGRGGAAPHEGVRPGLVLQPLAPGALAQGRDVRVVPQRRGAEGGLYGDAILVRVRADGPACHTGAESCFAPWLWRRVAERAKERPEGSYVTKLLADGPKAAAQKVGEEGVEVAVAGVSESDEALIGELADLWFHSYVLLAARGLDPNAVEDELRRRIR